MNRGKRHLNDPDVSEFFLEPKLIEKCLRCGGYLVCDPLADYDEAGYPIRQARCVNCGERYNLK